MSEVSLSKPYVFRGAAYLVAVITSSDQLTVSIEERVTGNQWKGTFSVAEIEELTEKTGHFESFKDFVAMVRAALTQSSEAVTLDLLTSADLKLLHSTRTGTQSDVIANDSSNKKRFLLLVNAISPNRIIKYPMRLRSTDPVELREIVRKLQEENQKLKQQRQKEYVLKELDQLKIDYDRLLKEKEELETEFNEYRQDAEGGVNLKEANEIRILKDFIKTLEKEICDHQRIVQKRKDQYRKVLTELDEVRASERNLQVRVKSLTNELAQYKRRGSRAFPGSMTSRTVNSNSRNSSRTSNRNLSTGSRYNSSRDSSGLSTERSCTRPRLNNDPLVNRNRSTSRESCLSSRNKFISKDRSLSRDRFRSPNTSAGSLRITSSSPSGDKTRRFDPTAFHADKQRRQKENDMKKKRQINSKMASGDFMRKSKMEQGARSNLFHGRDLRRSRTPSVESMRSLQSSIESLSDIAFQSDVSDGHRKYSQNGRKSRLTNFRQQNGHRLPPVNANVRTSGKMFSSTPDDSMRTLSRLNSDNKENQISKKDVSPKSKEMLDLDARLSRLQKFLAENDIKY